MIVCLIGSIKCCDVADVETIVTACKSVCTGGEIVVGVATAILALSAKKRRRKRCGAY